MTQKELSRYEIIKRLIRKEINRSEAVKQMDLSGRQVKRIKARVIKEGLKGVIHRNRGRVGNRRIKPEIILVSRDDATNDITKMKFASDEGLKPVFGFWKEYFLVHGKPLKIYLEIGSLLIKILINQ